MSRPADAEWAVLDESADPVPGDPYEIRTEAVRLGKMAATIQDQITLLKDIAGDENVGKYADTLRDTATDLRGGLEKVATRYEHVSDYLGHWADDLDQCQSESLKALARARAVAATALAPDAKPDPGAAAPTPAEEQQQATDKHAKEVAQGELAAAKTALARVKDHRDDRAQHWMQKIEDTEHDGLKDSRWDAFKDLVHEHAGLIKLLADVCTWIVTILVVASFFVPGLDLLTPLLAVLMLTALAGHTSVALTGDGSWIDVGMDIVALATLGSTKWLLTGLKASTEFAEVTAKVLRGAVDVEDLGPSAINALNDGMDLTRIVSQDGQVSVWSTLADYGRAVGIKFLHAGENDAVESLTTLKALAQEFPDTRLFPNALARGKSTLKAIRLSNLTANVVDQFGHWAGGSDVINWIGNGFEGGVTEPELEGDTAPRWAAFGRLKELTTHEVGR